MNRATVKMAKLLKIFWKGEILRGSELLVYNEGTFSQPRHHSKSNGMKSRG